MKKIIFITLMISTLLCLSGCQSLWYLFLDAVVDIAPDRFTFEEDQKKISIPIVTSHALDKNNNETEYLIIMIHGYAETLSPQLVRTRLLTRPVMFVLGTSDTDRSWSLDKSCEGEAQGENRYQRGLLYKHHLGHFLKTSLESQHVWLEIPEVGHDATEVFTHPRFITAVKTLDF